MAEFQMPSLGADMEAGTIVEWKVRPGDRVHRGDVVAVVDTDKADIDAEIFEDGVVGEILVEAGEKVPVGTVLATVTPDGVAALEPAVATPARSGPIPSMRSPIVRRLAERSGLDTRAIAGTGPGGRVTRADVEAAIRSRPERQRRSPRARRLASANRIDLGTVRGTGPGGAVTGADVLAGGARPVQPKPLASRRGVDRARTMQQRTASLMETANREIPHYWVTRDVDFAHARAWLVNHNATLPPAQRALEASVLLAATARAASAMPNFNGRWLDGRFEPAPTVNLGLVVVLRGGGLLVPVLTDAQTLTVTETMGRMADLVRRARAGHLRSSDVSEPTITVSSLGDQGADAVLGVIYPPQVALVGYGRVTERAWADNGMLGVRPVVTASVAGDHRVSDGHEASRLLSLIDQFVQEPQSLEEAKQ